RPEADHIKVNYDVAWQKESGKADVGFVARNYNGDVLFSGARLDYYARSPLEAEAKPVHWAMSHALSRGYSRVTFETDSLCLVKGNMVAHNIASLALICSYEITLDDSIPNSKDEDEEERWDGEQVKFGKHWFVNVIEEIFCLEDSLHKIAGIAGLAKEGSANPAAQEKNATSHGEKNAIIWTLKRKELGKNEVE
ncbi:reverse transcriptase, partial [Tanacetum coccineum]